MGLKGFYRRFENRILASLLLFALLVFVGLRYDYFYDLNDDWLMKDLLSGVYTGVPEGHNIQMLYPLSLFLSLLYRIFPDVPVYGGFLCLCQYGSIWLAVCRSLRFGRNTGQKAAMAVAEGGAIIALLLPHLVFVQYTFTSAMLAAAAAFLFVTSDREENGDGQFFAVHCARKSVRKHLPCILLAALSYMLRTEMLLLLLPLICCAGMYRWSLEKKIFTGENAVKYLTVIGGILGGMLAAYAIHGAAFGSAEWKEYVEFFDIRTELYDFQGIPPYEGNEELYGSLQLSEAAQDMLLEQYNFGLEESLDARALERIAAYQSENKAAGQPFLSLVMDKLGAYRYRSFHRTADDYPWNLLTAVGYVLVSLAVCGNAFRQGRAEAAGGKDKCRKAAGGIGKLLFLLLVRTVLWMFILIRGRDPVRITHSLYWMELSILFAVFHVEAAGAAGRWETESRAVPKGREGNAGRKLYGRSGRLFYALAAAAVLWASMGALQCMASTDREYRAREAASAADRERKAYCRAHPGNFYFIDVYSSVSYPLEPYPSTPYSEKMFADVDNRLGNYDIMGGWLVKSPAQRKKLQAFGISSVKEALLEQENVFLMVEMPKGTDSLETYFGEQGRAVKMELVDRIGGFIGVYKAVGR